MQVLLKQSLLHLLIWLTDWQLLQARARGLAAPALRLAVFSGSSSCLKQHFWALDLQDRMLARKEKEIEANIARKDKDGAGLYAKLEDEQSIVAKVQKQIKENQSRVEELEEELELYGLSEKYRSEIGDDSSYDFIYQWKYDSS